MEDGIIDSGLVAETEPPPDIPASDDDVGSGDDVAEAAAAGGEGEEGSDDEERIEEDRGEGRGSGIVCCACVWKHALRHDAASRGVRSAIRR